MMDGTQFYIRKISVNQCKSTYFSNRIRFNATILPFVVSIALKTTPYVPEKENYMRTTTFL